MRPAKAPVSALQRCLIFTLFVCPVVAIVLSLAAPPTLIPAEDPLQLQTPANQSSGATRAYLILAKGPVDSRLAGQIRQGLTKAAEAGAQVVVLEIDTLGGDLEAALEIRDALLDRDFRTVALINKRAISAGALMALATHEIVMVPGATIGAAEPMRLTWTGPKPAGEKILSYFRKEMKATAESRDHPGTLAEAMVDPDVVVPDVVEKGKLLTLTTQEALKLKLAAAQKENLDQLLAAYRLELVPESRQAAARAGEAKDRRGWFEQIPAWQIWVIVGLLLAAAEILIPGFFVLWFAVGAFLAALLAFLGVPRSVQLAAFLVSSFLLLVFSRTIFRSALFRSRESTVTNVEALRGRHGVVLKAIEGTLQPGSVKVGGEVWSAVCEDDARIVKGIKVEVLEVVGNKVRVKPV